MPSTWDREENHFYRSKASELKLKHTLSRASAMQSSTSFDNHLHVNWLKGTNKFLCSIYSTERWRERIETMGRSKVTSKAAKLPAKQAVTRTCFKVPENVKEWFASGRFQMMESVERRALDSINEKSMMEARQRLANLAHGQDTKGIKFTGEALHHLYYSTKFERRGLLLYSILGNIFDQRSSVSPDLRSALQRSLTKSLGSAPQLKIASIGGGPGKSMPSTSIPACRICRSLMHVCDCLDRDGCQWTLLGKSQFSRVLS
eukprot:607155-Hanusia_phi.AAC.4